jgi:precorrin-3B C17-methyltransferase
VVVGYPPYLKKIEDLTTGKELVATGMTHEVERCRTALHRAAAGATVALISSGDPGIYGMAGLAIELAAAEGLNVPIEVIPGVTAASAAAAKLGAPLMVDFAVISLSDQLITWDVILKRLEAAAAADFVTALYNPRSQTRVTQLDEAVAIFRRHRPSSTPVGIATAVGTDHEHSMVTDLGHLLEFEIGMTTIVIVGNLTSKRIGDWFVTARGYHV